MARTLTDLLAKRRAYAEHDGERFLDAEQNARLVANAERYYRIMYYGSRASWNLRDSHMFDTLKNLLAFHGAGQQGGGLGAQFACRQCRRDRDGRRAASTISASSAARSSAKGAYLIGFGTHSGTVAAAIRLGRADGDQDACGRRSQQL